MENLYEPNCIRTFSGIYFNILEPVPEMVNITDIAHSLSHQCRFAGHIKYFYSVAQHSISVCRAVNKYKLEALMHDAAEAYLLDIPKPVKELLPDYRALGDRINRVIAERFNLIYPWPDEVILADIKMLEDEWEYLVLNQEDISISFDCGKGKFLQLFAEFRK